jgi:nucleotidyltransferase substrate binding protein (TIGR01987 family)
MGTQDVRWIQRYNSFSKALSQLREAVNLAEERPLSNLEQQGLIQAFEFTHEQAWNTLKDFLENQGAQNLFGSKDVTRAAVKSGLIGEGEAWMDMIQSRNLTTHTYNEATAAKIASAVQSRYIHEFTALQQKLSELMEGWEH